MKKNNQQSVQTWVWRSMVKTGIIPLVVVELVLVAIYLISNHYISTDNMDYIRSHVNEELDISTTMESNLVRERLLSLTRLTDIYRKETERTLSEALKEDEINMSNLSFSQNGILYSKQDNGGAASFYSSYTKNEEKDLDKVFKLARLDSLMKQIKNSDEFIAAVYFNSWDSYNRIYPWFQTLEQYPADMNIPDYNFYYLATEKYNPRREVVWTDVYIDPAGQGWMTSAIAPVYNHGKLEGVVGIDITVGTIVANIQNLIVPWDGYAVLVSSEGNIMALPPQGEKDLNIKELKDHEYKGAITEEVFKPETFNLYKREDTSLLKQEFEGKPKGLTKLVLNGENKLLSWATIPETNWKILFVVDENKMYQESLELKDKYQNIGYIMICGLVTFYVLFLIFTWFVSKRMSKNIAYPLSQIRNMFYQVSTGKFAVTHEKFNLKELNDTANATIRMGSRLQKLTDELKAAKLDAENANVAKSQFISNISHEIRTPMNSILALSDILLAQNMDKEQRNSLVTIKKSGEHLLLVINDVLDFSKIESGRLDIEYIPFSLYSVVQDVYDLFEQKIANKGLTLTVEVEEHIPFLNGDPLRIKQVLINFVSNALKFTKQGEVALKVKLLNTTESIVSLRFEVTDTGIGLSSEQQSNIFESFQQADTSTTRKYGGTGLGLTISRCIAHLMGGEIGVESVLGEGSQFWFEVDLTVSVVKGDSEPFEALTMSISEEQQENEDHLLSNLDLVDLQTKLDYLIGLLEQDNLEAEDYYFAHKNEFEFAVPKCSRELAEHIAQCDFAKALVVALRVKKVLSENRLIGSECR